MGKKLLNWSVSIVVSSVSLVILAGGIWSFMKDSGTAFGTVLFYMGSLPIIVFSMALIGDFFNRGNISYQLSRSTSEADMEKRQIQDIKYFKSIVTSQWNWLISGLLVVLISVIM